MSRHLVTLKSREDRLKVADWAMRLPWRTRIQFLEPKRSVDQNSRMWLMLSAISKKLKWHGQWYSDAEWKDYFMHAYRGEKWMPFEDGGMIPIGRSTSALSASEHCEFTALIEAFCARHGVSLPWDGETCQ